MVGGDYKMIIGICGLIGSGKDTTADYLVNVHQYRRDSYANTLKDVVSAVFGWPRDMLEGRTKHSREWREQVDAWWATRLGMPDLTPRYVLQYWGTDVLRNHFHNDIWIASMENKLRTMQDDIVISDCRFPNEIKSIKNAGGLVIRVQRGPDPEWFVNTADYFKGKCDLPDNLPHASEWSWVGTEFDAVLDNNGTMDSLFQQVNDLVQDHQVSKVARAA